MGALRIKGMQRVNALLAARFLIAVTALSGIRLLLPTTIFTALPDAIIAGIEAMPLLIIAMIWLNRSIPQGMLKVRGIVCYILLLVPAVYGFTQVQALLAQWMPVWTGTLDRWALSSLAVYMLRPLILAATLLSLFTMIWKLSFGMGKRMRAIRLISPWFWGTITVWAVIVSYTHMVKYAQLNASSTVYGTLFGQGAPEGAYWYTVDPITSLILYWTAQPLETLLYGYVLLGGMRMFRVAYPVRAASGSLERMDIPTGLSLLQDDGTAQAPADISIPRQNGTVQAPAAMRTSPFALAILPGDHQEKGARSTLPFPQQNASRLTNHRSPFSKPMASAFPGPSGAFSHHPLHDSPESFRQGLVVETPLSKHRAKTG